MLTRFNHVAIVVPDLEEAKKKYKDILNANVSDISNYAEHGVSVVFLLILEILKLNLCILMVKILQLKIFLKKILMVQFIIFV